MKNLIDVENIYLTPGGFFWGEGRKRVLTILGSCVSICLWHPFKKTGGICHYQMPGKRARPRNDLNPKYGDDVFWIILEEVKRHKTKPEEYTVKLFGGAIVLHSNLEKNSNPVSNQNCIKAIERLEEHGFTIISHDIGGEQGRKLYFDLWDGTVWLKKLKKLNA